MITLKNLYQLRSLCKDSPDGGYIPSAEFTEIYSNLPKECQRYIAKHWYFGTARFNQIIPWHLDWQMELDIPGRGFGKNWKISENVVELALNEELIQHFTGGKGNLIVNVFAETVGEADDTVIRGDSGIAKALERRGYELVHGTRHDKPASSTVLFLTSQSILQLKFPNGTLIRFYGSKKTKGKQAHVTIADEVLTFYEFEVNKRDQLLSRFYEECLTTTRLGPDPRIVWISTPRPVPILKRLLERNEKQQDMLIVTGTTFDNPYLPESYKERLMEEFGGTTRGRQELEGVVTWTVPGALWKEHMIIHTREVLDELNRIVVAIDPAATNNRNSDETGIVVCARGSKREDGRNRYYVLEDKSGKFSPREWAQRAIDLYHKHKANVIVYESNQGGDMIAETIRTLDKRIPLKAVRASKGKLARAEPIAALYEQELVYHVGRLPELEAQLLSYDPRVSNYSPDRLDALVYSLHELSNKSEYKITWI